MVAPTSSPPASPAASPASKGTQTPLSLDLSSIPPLTQPTPPSNTLIITNLSNPSIFSPHHLASLRDTLESTTPDGLHSFSPLRSFQRIIISLPTVADALSLRSLLDNIPIMDCKPRIYFGEPTPLTYDEEARYLSLPKTGRLFFISPPPSPPMGWEMREEEAPNKETWARDLAEKLKGLGGGNHDLVDGGDDAVREWNGDGEGVGRKRSGTGGLVVYEPGLHGAEEGLPAVVVDDTEAADIGEEGEGGGRILTHTARPPVELME